MIEGDADRRAENTPGRRRQPIDGPANGVAEAERRARESAGVSEAAIYRMVVEAIRWRHPGGGMLLDIGCGVGNLWGYVRDRFDAYAGADVVSYEGFPPEGMFHRVNLDDGRVPLPDGGADVVAAIETIEHVENPRAFVRELVRLARPGGIIVLTTPNQLSLLSKLTLGLKGQFNAFQEGPGLYPSHLTALLEVDLRRIARECGISEVEVRYSGRGRIPGTPWHWPGPLRGRAFSDNVLLAGRRPG